MIQKIKLDLINICFNKKIKKNKKIFFYLTNNK